MITKNLDIFQGDWNGMAHCANLYHVMGGGIAKIIKEKFPEAYSADCATGRGCYKLGTFSWADISNNRQVFNLYGQEGIGNDGNPLNRNVRYDAIHDSLYNLCKFIEGTYLYSLPYTLAIPHGMGCGLAGGDWNIVNAILESISNKFKHINIQLYKL